MMKYGEITFKFIFTTWFVLLSSNPVPLFAQTWFSLIEEDNLSKWVKRGGSAFFEVNGGEIVGISRANTENTFLCSKQEFEDFILEFVFFVDSTLNSGVQIRSHCSINGSVQGCQFEIDPTITDCTGGIYDEARRGWLYHMSNNVLAQKAFKTINGTKLA